ncbi:MAG: DUF4266 domain-containing protein [Betaproteobacteria bacterium]|nr:DUF4266 domain-containing protein [Betaproteobacteria bacterium]
MIRTLITATALCLPLVGCASIGSVEPWQKGVLAKPEMSFDDEQASTRYNEHIYSSRETTAGGASVGGGGCGCN